MKRILIVHGPNLNLLGKREPAIYGKVTIEAIDRLLKETARDLGAAVEVFQSNHEGEIVSRIGESAKSFDGILINPAAYTHTSVAIRDAITAAGLPTVEVHLSNIYAREAFRHNSLVAPVALGQVSGFGIESYRLGLVALIRHLASRKPKKAPRRAR